MQKVLIIIPAYNEEENIEKVLNSLKKLPKNFIPIVINDGSADKTSVILKRIKVLHLDLPFNMGIGNAVHTGYLYANRNGFDIAIQFDGDGQHPVEFLDKLISPLNEDKSDFVIGSRYLRKDGGFQSSFPRRLGIKFLSILIRILTGKKISDPTSGFRAVNRKGIEVFAKSYPDDYPEPEAIIIAHKKKIRISEVPVRMHARSGGTSSINAIRSVYYMIKVSLAILLKNFQKDI